MYWNHRVVRHRDHDSDTEHYDIREVFYDDDHTIINWTASEVGPAGKSMEELRTSLEQIRECLDQPVLDAHKLPGYNDSVCEKPIDDKTDLNTERN